MIVLAKVEATSVRATIILELVADLCLHVTGQACIPAINIPPIQ
jgi:hypothetical protein